MKWIKASERLPEFGKKQFYVKYKYNNKALETGLLFEGEYKNTCQFFEEDGATFMVYNNGIYICLNDLEYCYWLDETPEDWNLLEKQFNEDFNTLTDKPTTGYDVIKWIKEKLG